MWLKLIALAVFAVANTEVSATSRIIGGSDAAIESFPAAVQVESSANTFWHQICGATILNSLFVLSAAHCFSGRNYDDRERRIRAGATERNVGGTVVYISGVVIHPSYDSSTLDGDIVVVRLSSQLTFGATMQQGIIIAQDFQFPANLPAVYVGWGTTSASGSNAETLQAANVMLVDRDACAAAYQSLAFPRTVTENMICAGLQEGGADACRDDAGGPLYYAQFVIGVISWGQGCGVASFPGVNTRVSAYTNWIVANAV